MAQFKEFKEKIPGDAEFAKKYEDAATVADLVAPAAGDGFVFTEDDVKNDTELADAELRGVAGGIVFRLPNQHPDVFNSGRTQELP
jgi:predicted ribosomally synthesized peptide with nif11-like leader